MNTVTPNDDYEWLRRHSIELSHWRTLRDLAAWDQRTYLPATGHSKRAEQLACLAVLIHEKVTDPRVGERLAAAEESEATGDPMSPRAVNLREWRRAYDRVTKIPRSLAEAMARATAEGETAWERAREANDWDAFQPHLKTIISLLREKADAVGFKNEPYDALVDDYEPGETTGAVEQLFGELKDPLIGLIDRIRGSDHPPDTTVLRGHFPLAAQKAFSEKIAALLGFDFDAGRLDESAHPFTVGMGPRDVRITTRYNESSLTSALLGTIHETGHALYEQGLDPAHDGTPMGEAVSLGVHESQSRFYENFIGRSLPFWRMAFPLAQETFSGLTAVTPECFVNAMNVVTPSLIRVEADEVTYNLHIIMRFELEAALFRNELDVTDLPDAWNDKMSHYFRITPPDPAQGVLQDVHWSAGLQGYFPTYTLGNLYAAQIFHRMKTDIDLENGFTETTLTEILQWLRENIHRRGAASKPRTLVEEATGTSLSPTPFLEYCETKYSELYRLR